MMMMGSKDIRLLAYILVLSVLLSELVGAFSPARPLRFQQALLTVKAVANSQDEGRRDFLAASASAVLILLPTTMARAADDDDDAATATVHKVDYPIAGKCGQAQVPTKVVGLVKTFGGFQDGQCAADGYATPEGTASGTTDKDQQRTYNVYGK